MDYAINLRYVQKIEGLFFKQFLSKPKLVVRSPGRVNIIGEHTDYNEGFVLPAAIDMYAYVAVDKSSDGKIHLYSSEYKQQFVADKNNLGCQLNSWTDYVIGVVDQLQKNGHDVGGFNLLLSGNLPMLSPVGLNLSTYKSGVINFAVRNVICHCKFIVSLLIHL